MEEDIIETQPFYLVTPGRVKEEKDDVLICHAATLIDKVTGEEYDIEEKVLKKYKDAYNLWYRKRMTHEQLLQYYERMFILVKDYYARKKYKSEKKSLPTL